MYKIKNINSTSMKKKKKYRLQKIMIGALVSALSISTLTGCVRNRYDRYNDAGKNNFNYMDSYFDYDNYSSNYDSTTQPITNETSIGGNNETYEVEMLDDELQKIISTNITINGNDTQKLYDYISSISIVYPGEELYFVSENLNKYYNLKDYNSTSKNLFTNNKISSETIYSYVLKNNSLENFNTNAKMSDNDLKKVCDVLADTINYKVANSNNIDLVLLSEKIINLKIKKFSGFSNGSYDPKTGIMGFDIDKIRTDSSLFEKVVAHETSHLIQASSQKESEAINIDSRFGPSYKFNDSKIDSLSWNWFYEGTAEEIMMGKTNSNEALTYNNFIRIINTIKCATVLNPNINPTTFENLSMTSDLSKLFEYFDCRTEKDREEIIKMMFAYELVSKLSGSEMFYDSYEKIYGEMNYYEKKSFEIQTKGSIALTLSKQFYKNLAYSMENKQVNLNEIFELISIFESEMNKLSWYATTGYVEDLKEFIINYVGIQNEFFGIISSKTGISVENLNDAYILYNAKYSFKLSNISILSNEENECYKRIKTDVERDKTKAIRLFEKEAKKVK